MTFNLLMMELNYLFKLQKLLCILHQLMNMFMIYTKLMNKNLFYIINFLKITNNSFIFSMYMILFMSTYMVMTSPSWLTSWIFLEINMMTFIPMMKNKNKLNSSSNSMIKYFLIQSISSMLMFISFILMYFFMIYNNPNSIYLIKIMISLALLIKLGAAPFHWWIPHVIIKLNWKNCFILLTWQKLAPLSLIIQVNEKNMLMNMSAMLSMILGAILGLNQSSIKLLLAYSSINHIGWIIMNSMMNKILMLLYLLIYSLMNFFICMLMHYMNINYIKQVFSNLNKNPINMILLMTMFLSLGGLPPLLGFLPKFLTLMISIKTHMFMESMVMIFTSLIILKFYMNMMTPAMNIIKIMVKYSNSKYSINTLIYSLMINFILSFIILTFINYTS